jgi:formylglycine-generating enzyme
MNKKVICSLVLLIVVSGLVFSENKTALVVGNSAYEHFPKLSRPRQEAGLMKAALERLGFDVVYVVDGTYDQMYDALYTFERKLRQRGGTAFFHYGGHGIQVDGDNYLLPIDKYIPDERRVKSRAVQATEIVDLMAAAGSDTNIIVLDACRDNPLPAATRSTSTRGLAKLSAPVNTVVVYSAAAGAAAEDGVFTPTLLEYLEMPGLSFTDILRQTRRAVYEKTGGKQVPGSYDQLFDAIYLAGRPSGSLGHTERTEIPEGFVLVEAGTFTMGSPVSDKDRYNNEKQHTVRITRDFYISKYEVTQAEWKAVMGKNPSSFAGDNLPVEYVSWYEAVEYCNRRSERDGVTPAYTISGNTVTWNKNANGYRLPTEAEWEYAARGGHKADGYTVYAGSDRIENVAWYSDNSGGKTNPVGRKQANELGIYDMSGNVYEWCWDWYGDYPAGSVTDPSGPSSSSERVLRGGSWTISAKNCRSANRSHSPPSRGGYFLGFRLVRLP